MIYRDAIEIRFYNSGGPGGQHRNRSASDVEMRLKPEAAAEIGIPAVKATASGRSQSRNLATARRVLRSRIAAEVKRLDAKGRFAAGNDRVRNYHEPDNRVTDSSGLRWPWRETAGKGDLAPCIDGRRDAVLVKAGGPRDG